MDNSRRFHVYVHHRATDGRIFYVGKATKSRATNTTHRSEWWKRIYRKHGRRVRYIKRHMPQACALSLERILIHVHGRENLCNMADGGVGVSGITEENRAAKALRLTKGNNPSYDPVLYDFWSARYGAIKSTKMIMRKAFGITSGRMARLVDGRQKYVDGWMLLGNKGMYKGTKYRPNRSTVSMVDNYIRDDGLRWSGNPYDFCAKFSLNAINVYKLRTGRDKLYRGWRMDVGL